ncbi:hypothetical protein PoB_007091300 [Plakobranchus ocellatus]|uniref:Uncharacterized protein n=1 Tax=Plakobranchus ocellatus TaxID=259542 RepID=A0AAV4DK11_9GAST|nr:hypothetical protein PoB_007091300 [Plakobranchus ocellatus]
MSKVYLRPAPSKRLPFLITRLAWTCIRLPLSPAATTSPPLLSPSPGAASSPPPPAPPSGPSSASPRSPSARQPQAASHDKVHNYRHDDASQTGMKVISPPAHGLRAQWQWQASGYFNLALLAQHFKGTHSPSYPAL